MTKLPDEAQRIRALTDLAATLLVEAAAGTGKTSLLAGRVLCLLADAVPPREIAAITFTEFAAGELRERIARYLEEMLSGRVPEDLRLAFPSGPTREQGEALQQARKRLDELTCTTIHGFCHVLLRIYAVEAAIDPGAEIIDRTQADLAFATFLSVGCVIGWTVRERRATRSRVRRKMTQSAPKNCCASSRNFGRRIEPRGRCRPGSSPTRTCPSAKPSRRFAGGSIRWAALARPNRT
jgi:hypothetical protein